MKTYVWDVVQYGYESWTKVGSSHQVAEWSGHQTPLRKVLGTDATTLPTGR